MSSFYKLNIKEVKRETKDAVSILFNVPSELQSNYKFVAGQYLNIKLTLDGEEIRRAYSICSAPESGELRIAVKAVKNGLFSQFANAKLKAGDLLEVGSPEGKFTFEPQHDRQRNYAAFAAGSGITPVMSIAKSVLTGEPKALLYWFTEINLQKTLFFIKNYTTYNYTMWDVFCALLLFTSES